jgi:hypothetical protein
MVLNGIIAASGNPAKKEFFPPVLVYGGMLILLHERKAA